VRAISRTSLRDASLAACEWRNDPTALLLAIDHANDGNNGTNDKGS
jgi:hypothetical protein